MLRRSIGNMRMVVPTTAILLVVLAALLAPLLAPADPTRMNPGKALLGPNRSFPLGTDEYGRDVLSRLLFGARISVRVAFLAVCGASVSGTALGLIAGYYRGLVDTTIMRSMDVILCFPPILMAVVVLAIFGSSLVVLMATIALVYMPTFARVTYSTTMNIKTREYVTAARAIGATDPRIMVRHILPNIAGVLIVQVSLVIGYSILLEAGLSFLGLGISPPTPSWGYMVASARTYMVKQPLTVIWPSLAVIATVLSCNVLGDALRDVLDPLTITTRGR